MASSFIPNSNPAIGRTSMQSSARLRKSNSTVGRFFRAFVLAMAVESWTLGVFNAQRSTLNAQRSIQTVECWASDVGRWTLVLFRRVRGAWWPSRSSKPLLIPRMRDQGRFDSYPLRQLTFGVGGPIFDVPATSLSKSNSEPQTSNIVKGGERMSREQIRRLTSLSSCAG
jgi:hypothetical protein